MSFSVCGVCEVNIREVYGYLRLTALLALSVVVQYIYEGFFIVSSPRLGEGIV